MKIKKAVTMLLSALIVLSVISFLAFSTNTKVVKADGGYQWVDINSGLYGGMVNMVTIDPDNPSTIYAATDNGVFKSVDKGNHWVAVSKGLPKFLPVYCLVFDPSNTKVIYAATRDNVYKTTNGAKNWVSVSKGLLEGEFYVNTLVLSPQNPQTLYASNGIAIYKSTDGGESWNNVGSSPNKEWIRTLAISPKDPDTLFAITNYKLYKSTDGGLHWNLKYSTGKRPFITDFITINDRNPELMYSNMGSEGLYKSTDGGENWKACGFDGKIVTAFAINPQNSSVVYASVNEEGLYRSTDGGKSWDPVNAGLDKSILIDTIAIDSQNPDVIYIGSANMGVFRSVKSGEDCEAINNGLSSLSVQTIAVNPENPQEIYAGTNYMGLLKSVNGGKSWVRVSNGISQNISISSIAFNRVKTENIYIGTNAGIFKSSDSGSTWHLVFKGDGESRYILSVAVSQSNPQIAYAMLCCKGLYKSTDGGKNWKKLGNGLPDVSFFGSLVLDPDNPDTLYATMDKGLYKSTDGGKNWNLIGFKDKYIVLMTINPLHTNILYAISKNNLYESSDSGKQWKLKGSILSPYNGPYFFASSFTLDPYDSNVMYVGTIKDGIYKSVDGGKNWHLLKGTKLYNPISCIKIAKEKGKESIYIGTEGNGILKTEFDILPPSAPENLIAKVDYSGNSVVLNWDAAKQGTYPIAGYAVYRGSAQSKESDTPIATVSADTLTYVDNTVKSGDVYYYVVKAFDNENEPEYSQASNEVKVGYVVDTTPPELTVNSPKNFEVVHAKVITVSGIVKDEGTGIDSLTVDGIPVSVQPDGSFSVNIALNGVSNVITFVAVDRAGNTTTKSITVTYNPETVITLQPDNSTMTVNGVQQEIDPGRGTKPVIIPKWGRTVVPIRAIVEALGGTIEWDGAERKVTINLNGTTIELWIGKPQAKVNGEMKWIDPSNHDVKPIIVNSRTMLPLRFVAENLGCTVEWDASTRTITITYAP